MPPVILLIYLLQMGSSKTARGFAGKFLHFKSITFGNVVSNVCFLPARNRGTTSMLQITSSVAIEDQHNPSHRQGPQKSAFTGGFIHEHGEISMQ